MSVRKVKSSWFFVIYILYILVLTCTYISPTDYITYNSGRANSTSGAFPASTIHCRSKNTEYCSFRYLYLSKGLFSLCDHTRGYQDGATEIMYLGKRGDGDDNTTQYKKYNYRTLTTGQKFSARISDNPIHEYIEAKVTNCSAQNEKQVKITRPTIVTALLRSGNPGHLLFETILPGLSASKLAGLAVSKVQFLFLNSCSSLDAFVPGTYASKLQSGNMTVEALRQSFGGRDALCRQFLSAFLSLAAIPSLFISELDINEHFVFTSVVTGGFSTKWIHGHDGFNGLVKKGAEVVEGAATYKQLVYKTNGWPLRRQGKNIQITLQNKVKGMNGHLLVNPAAVERWLRDLSNCLYENWRVIFNVLDVDTTSIQEQARILSRTDILVAFGGGGIYVSSLLVPIGAVIVMPPRFKHKNKYVREPDQWFDYDNIDQGPNLIIPILIGEAETFPNGDYSVNQESLNSAVTLGLKHVSSIRF